MGRALYKIGENEYVEFSSIVDDAVTYVFSKDCLDEYEWLSPTDRQRLERFHTTSYVDGPFDSPSAAAKGMFERYALKYREFDENDDATGAIAPDAFQTVDDYMHHLRTGWMTEPDVVLGEN